MSLPYLLFSVSGMSREEESAGAPDQTWPALHEGGTSAHSLIAPSSSQGNRFLGNVSKAGSIQTSDTGTNTPRLATGRMVPTCNECNEAIEGTPYDATKQIIFRNRVKMSPINICGDCKEELFNADVDDSEAERQIYQRQRRIREMFERTRHAHRRESRSRSRDRGQGA